METLYTKILFATDLGPQSLYIGEHAKKLSSICQAKLYIMHVIEPPLIYTAYFSEHEKEIERIKQNAKKSLNALSQELGIQPEDQILATGSPQEEILEIRDKKQCDLIVVGSHGIGGYTHSLGSTANHLLSESKSDVLIVQVKHLQKNIEIVPASSGLYLWQTLGSPHHPKQAMRGQYSGSEKGFGEEIKRGPRLSKRPPGSPYHGGTRTDTSNDNDDDSKKET